MNTDIIHQITVPTPYPVGDVHIYLVEGKQLSVVDAGVKTAAAKRALTQQLNDLGFSLADVEQVILTHHHPDHIGLVDQFPNAKAVCGHRNNRPWLTKDEAFLSRYQAFFQDLYKEAAVPDSYKKHLVMLRAPLRFIGEAALTNELVEGDVLPGHEDFIVIETPGHASSHLAFYRKRDGVLIGGDLLLANTSSNPLLEPAEQPNQARPKPLIDYRDSLHKCLNLEIDKVFPGHGSVINHPTALIYSRLEKQEARAAKVLAFVQETSATAFEVCQYLFPKQIDQQFGLTMSEAIGQLDYLEMEGKITTAMIQGVRYYSKN
ncbi:MBL fold metallo-hydrolase [Radiobacillus sp. PE A8.2]|uniref:MBL fold metallo-hydrolase n=1 Tax=Radiobacillus sp. PE A8.2 TaxID=3380349 RepID=UPI0038908562